MDGMGMNRTTFVALCFSLLCASRSMPRTKCISVACWVPPNPRLVFVESNGFNQSHGFVRWLYNIKLSLNRALSTLAPHVVLIMQIVASHQPLQSIELGSTLVRVDSPHNFNSLIIVVSNIVEYFCCCNSYGSTNLNLELASVRTCILKCKDVNIL